MKKQTFIAIVKDTSNKQVDFYRFICKRTGTIERQINKAFQTWPSYLTTGWNSCEIYATPDGVNQENLPSAVIYLNK